MKKFDDLLLLLSDVDAKFYVAGSGADKNVHIVHIVPVKVLSVLKFLVDNNFKCSLMDNSGIIVYNKVVG